MAWTPEKNVLLYQMIKERFGVESNINDIKQWGITTTWTAIFDKYITEKQKQSILNDLIEDKIAFIDKSVVDHTSTTDALNSLKSTLLSDKEVVP